MKKQLKYLSVICLGIAGLSGCTGKADPSPERTETRTIEFFDAVEVRGDFDVYISPGQNYDITVTAPGNVLPYVQTYVEGSRLIIDEKHNHVRGSRMTVNLSNTWINALELSGSGRIRSGLLEADNLEIALTGSGYIESGVDANHLDAELAGSGRIKLYGKAASCVIDLSGSGAVDAMEVNARKAELALAGSGDIRVSATDTLYASLNGSGRIQYWGNPATVSPHITGSGVIESH